MSLVPYHSRDTYLPSPSSFLSNRLNKYLTGSSLPTRPSIAPPTYSSLLPDPVKPNLGSSYSAYRSSYLSDPLPSPPSTSRSSYRIYPSYTPSTSLYSSRRTPSRYTSYDDEDDYDSGYYSRRYRSTSRPRAISYYGNDDDLDTGYSLRRKYRSLSRPRATSYYDDEDDYDSYRSTRRYGNYSSPSSNSYLKLSSYDGPYDGSYDADMAEMYDYVPFGPSRSGILEVTSSGDDDSYVYPALTSSSTRSRYSPIPDNTSVRSGRSVSRYSQERESDRSLAKPSVVADNAMIESLVSSTAARAKAVIADSKLPYKNASLVLSVEGNALSEDGKNKYGFKYYPPPIPLTGGPIGLDERILGINPSSNSPADSFLGGYLTRLRSMHTEERDHMDADASRRASRASSVVSTSSPSYSHRTIRMPLTISGRENSVPVSSYRTRLDDGQSHRVDVFPLVETEASVPRDRKFELPVVSASGDAKNKLTLLDRISIKVIIHSQTLSQSKIGASLHSFLTEFTS